MGYDWERYREICYDLFVTEKKSVEDIMEYMSIHHKFKPSKRTYQAQFTKWGFRQLREQKKPAHMNFGLVNRVRQLWERNHSQREMLHILNEEGFEIRNRGLLRLRSRNRWFLRVPNEKRLGPSYDPSPAEREEEEDDAGQDDAQPVSPGQPGHDGDDATPVASEVAAGRDSRRRKMKAESDERLASRKRRRRTRPWAGFPADPPGPPRFPSETTLDQSKDILGLDRNLYQQIRARFQQICEESDVVKKTEAGQEKWEALKEQLVQETPHLQSVMYTEERGPSKKLALDVVCTDVTKRMRTADKRMTVWEAKSILGVNPEAIRELRSTFYKILKDDKVTSKLEAGEEHWREMKQRWLEGPELLQRILAPGVQDPTHANKVKALDVLANDAMKRWRDHQTRRNSSRRDSATDDDEPGIPSPPTEAVPDAPLDTQQNSPLDRMTPEPEQQLPREASPPIHQQVPMNPAMASGMDPQVGLMDSQLDPALLLGSTDMPAPAAFMEPSQLVPPFAQAPPRLPPVVVLLQPPAAIAIHLRLHPPSAYPLDNNLWIATLGLPSIAELRHAAAQKFPGTLCTLVEGLLNQGDGSEVGFEIDADEQLVPYLHDQFSQPTFVVQIVRAWDPDI